jgi:hypothetical protein
MKLMTALKAVRMVARRRLSLAQRKHLLPDTADPKKLQRPQALQFFFVKCLPM